MNYSEFVSQPKSMVTAPAGHGKTHAIAKCLTHLKHTKGRQLILTHTHAGIASLKEKIQKEEVANSQYRVETITGFAQKYVNAFYRGSDAKKQEEDGYYPFIVEKAAQLFKITPIKDVIEATYAGLFVDEYQDCTRLQHDLVQALADILPTRILGDDLQGIFYFDGQLVDFENDLNGFVKFPDLPKPWRWSNENPDLGEYLKQIRYLLEDEEDVDLDLYQSHIECIEVNEADKYEYRSAYNRKIWELSREDNILIIHPDYTNVGVRKKFTSQFKNAFLIVEAIDDKAFYDFSEKLDQISSGNAYDIIYDLMPNIFNGTSSRNQWFNDRGVKRKTSEIDKNKIAPIHENIERIKQSPSLSLVSTMLKKTKELPKIKCYRRELFSDLCRALEKAELEGISVYEAMKEIRNIKRRMGRKVKGRCIGTTLLTKGLEFDTVAILDAHTFNCPKHFYVAITRARKRLIIFTNNKILSPYKRGE